MKENWFSKNSRGDENRSEVFDNEHYLSTDFIPEELLYRDKEMEEIYSNFEKPFRDRIARHMLINGPPGTGKTHASKKVKREFNRHAREKGADYKVVYISSEKKTFYQLLVQLGQKIDNTLPIRGIGTGELRDRILAKIEQSNNKYIIIFDEVDKMEKSSHTQSDPIESVVKFVTRAHEYMEDDNGNQVVGVFIGNQQGIRERVAACSAATSSSFHPKKVYFRNYNADEMKDIIEHRCRKAFTSDFFTNGATSFLAGQIRSHSFDLRFGFEVLRQCGDWLENNGVNEIDEKLIEKAIKEVQSNNIEEIIAEMNDTKLITLWSILYGEDKYPPQQKTDNGITSKQFYDLYQNMTDSVGLEARSQAHITQNVASSLETEGLISTKIKGMGRAKGRAIIFYSAEIDDLKDIVGGEIENRFHKLPDLSSNRSRIDNFA